MLDWLAEKVTRASKRFAELATGPPGADGREAEAMSGGAQGFAARFLAMNTQDEPRMREEIEAESKQQALEAVCEYVKEDWAEKLAKKFG